MQAPKFFYGEDIIRKNEVYQLDPTQLTRSYSEKKKANVQLSKDSISPKTSIKNLTEFDSVEGQDFITKRRKYLFTKNKDEQSVGNLTSSSKIRLIKVPFQKIKSNHRQTSSVNNLENEQKFLLSLFQRDQNIENKKKKKPIHSQTHLHQRSLQSDLSFEKNYKVTLPSQTSFRKDSQRDFRDKKQIEQRQYLYKLGLAIYFTKQIFKKQNKLENFLDSDQKFFGFMNFTYNFINLPLNIEGLEQLFQAEKYLFKTLKPFIPQNLEPLLFEDNQCTKFRQLTFQYQLFIILYHQSKLIDITTNSNIKFQTKQSKEQFELIQQIEKILIQKKFQTQDFNLIEQLCEQLTICSFENFIMEAKSQCTILVEYEYVKQLYCFCMKVQEALQQRIVFEGNKKIAYDKGFNFEDALKQLKSRDPKREQMFTRYLPQKREITEKLEQFEDRFGKIDVISNVSRQHARLADIKHTQLYDRILKMRKQLE